MQRTRIRMDVNGKKFYMLSQAADVVGVHRTTVWRWRKEKKIPAGRRYRGREVLYTLEELESIYAYAHRMEPVDASTAVQNQLALFD